MKKLLSITLSLVLIISMAAPAMATAVTDSGETLLTTHVSAAYTVMIPGETVLTPGQTETAIGSVYLAEGAELYNGTVKVLFASDTTGEGGIFTLTKSGDASKTIPYDLTVGVIGDPAAERITDGDLKGLHMSGAGQGANITVVIKEEDWNAAEVGTYEGAIKFNISFLPVPLDETT